jgi:hypothetical protein
MEKIVTSPNLEMYELDLQEVNKFLSQCTRPNIKRQLEEYKRTLTNFYENEKRNLKKEDKESTTTTTTKTESVTSEVKADTTKPMTTITKYSFENGDKFVK